ncbi:hypothetical protein [Amycolatopsis magusensis]|uniref:hypothetical protein n=1 Tax=Amycolatopsis magusensis TaxID=882444 RepID=UPI0037AC3A6C
MSKESWRPVTSHLPWARFRTAVPVFVGLSGLAMLGIRVYYLVVHGMTGSTCSSRCYWWRSR